MDNCCISAANSQLRKTDVLITISRTPDTPLISELRAEIEALAEIGKKYDDIDSHIVEVVDGMGVMVKRYITQEAYDNLPEKQENVLYIIV
jgi:hypothetical protein